MSTLLVNGLGVMMIAATIWWFWLWKPKQGAQASNGVLLITVANGTYTPSTIDAVEGETITLEVVREDASPCAELFIIDGLGVNVQLSLHTREQVVINAPQPGDYPMHCQMNMYQGVLRVR